MACTRRQFLKRSGVATAGSLLGPALLGNGWIQKALADTIGDRYFRLDARTIATALVDYVEENSR